MILFIATFTSSIIGTHANPDLLTLLLIILRRFFVEALVDLRQRLRNPTALWPGVIRTKLELLWLQHDHLVCCVVRLHICHWGGWWALRDEIRLVCVISRGRERSWSTHLVQLGLQQVKFRAEILLLFLEILQDVTYVVGLSRRPRPRFLRLMILLALHLHSGRFLSEVSIGFKPSSHRWVHRDRILLVLSVCGCLHDRKLRIYGWISDCLNRLPEVHWALCRGVLLLSLLCMHHVALIVSDGGLRGH